MKAQLGLGLGLGLDLRLSLRLCLTQTLEGRAAEAAKAQSGVSSGHEIDVNTISAHQVRSSGGQHPMGSVPEDEPVWAEG